MSTKLRITLIDDEEDILTLYSDYLIGRGHLVFSSLDADNIMPDIVKNRPDIVLLDYKISGHKNGIDTAMEILAEYPLFPILFITAYEGIHNDILNYTELKKKNVSIMIKPILLEEIEHGMLNLVNECTIK